MHIQDPPGRVSFNQWSGVGPPTYPFNNALSSDASGRWASGQPHLVVSQKPQGSFLLGAVGLKWALEEGQTSGGECQVWLWTHQIKGTCGEVPEEGLGAAGQMLQGTGEHLL